MECNQSTPPHVLPKLASSGLILMDGCRRIEKKNR